MKRSHQLGGYVAIGLLERPLPPDEETCVRFQSLDEVKRSVMAGKMYERYS